MQRIDHEVSIRRLLTGEAKIVCMTNCTLKEAERLLKDLSNEFKSNGYLDEDAVYDITKASTGVIAKRR